MNPKAVVVGGGLAGLMSTIKLVERGIAVDLISLVPVKRSHSVCAQGGINAALNTKGEGDSVDQHFYDTIYGGDFLANQPPVRGMVDAAPELIYTFDRMGANFTRTEEGLLDLRLFGGVKKRRTVFAGATTGQQLEYTLDEQVRRHEDSGKVTKYEGWEFLKAVIDERGVCRGCIAQNLATMEIRIFRSDVVIIATGGAGVIYGKSTNSSINTGSAASIVYQQGAAYANAEFIQIHPTAMLGDDKTRLMSESARGEGGRVWTYKDGKPWYFLEEMYPGYGNLVPRDIASRAIHKVCVEMGLGIDGKNQVYLDLSHLDKDFLERRLGGIIEIYEKFHGDDPKKVPMKIYPGIHYFMGGVHVNWQHMTCMPGLFAAGECDYMYHGANRLGANSLLSAAYSGTVCGPAAAEYIAGLAKLAAEEEATLFETYRQKEVAYDDYVRKLNGKENPFVLHQEMGEMMTRNVGIVRYNKDLAAADGELQGFMERWHRLAMVDSNLYSNQTVMFVKQLKNMMELARVITIAALNRDESRGAHYKPEFPERNDKDYLKTTKAFYTADGPRFEGEDIDTSLLEPVQRTYGGSK